MSTRSAIIEQTANGYRGIYCHFDGYISNNGVILDSHYQDAGKVSKLIDLGDISSLGIRVEPCGPHSFDVREEGTTCAYMRDRGETDCEPITGMTWQDVASHIDHNGYVYVFTPNGWFVSLHGANLVPLKQAIVDLNKQLSMKRMNN